MKSLFKSTNNTRAILKSYKYIRSDVPNKLNSEEIKWLIHNKITTIIDLRTPEEVANKPCKWANINEFTYLNLPVTGGNIVPKNADEVAKSYIKMVDNKMWEIIDTIEKSSTNVMYFCSAGKDRTGVVSTILLARLGVCRDEIVADYMLSKSNLKDILTEYAEKNEGVNIDVITPNEAYINEFLDAINI